MFAAVTAVEKKKEKNTKDKEEKSERKSRDILREKPAEDSRNSRARVGSSSKEAV